MVQVFRKLHPECVEFELDTESQITKPRIIEPRLHIVELNRNTASLHPASRGHQRPRRRIETTRPTLRLVTSNKVDLPLIRDRQPRTRMVKSHTPTRRTRAHALMPTLRTHPLSPEPIPGPTNFAVGPHMSFTGRPIPIHT